MIFTLTSEGGDARSLAGDWLVRAAGAGEWRTVADRGLDESGWQATSTPGRWWLDPGLADENAVLYRRHFELPADLAAELDSAEHDDTHWDTHRDTHRDARWWLVASGLCELGHLWFDGTYLGDLRGRHAQHAFEVDHLLRRGREHLAAVEAAHGTARVPQPENAQVQIQRTGPARIQRVRALVIEASPDRAVLRVAATVDSSGTHRAEVTTTVLPTADPDAGWSKDPTRQVAVLGDGLSVSEPVLARGRNDLEWLVAIERPSLWWPAGMGDQAQYCIDIDVAVDGRSSHAVRLPTGIRTVSIGRGKLAVNGEPHRDGLDALRIVEHELSHPSFYESANTDGRLLCQQVTLDPSVFAGAQRGLRALAAQAASAAADHAGHHPSVATWQPVHPPGNRRRTPRLSSWADRTARTAMQVADPTRPQTQIRPKAALGQRP
ncbi:hypothetical protein [Candidatus Poriferisodalis sp.]|uniref:hypothetical protein n=1 Tax=Candidatus Poriferisodalis sp. TaxID=3101277 RepID=UPI003B01BE97